MEPDTQWYRTNFVLTLGIHFGPHQYLLLPIVDNNTQSSGVDGVLEEEVLFYGVSISVTIKLLFVVVEDPVSSAVHVFQHVLGDVCVLEVVLLSLSGYTDNIDAFAEVNLEVFPFLGNLWCPRILAVHSGVVGRVSAVCRAGGELIVAQTSVFH